MRQYCTAILEWQRSCNIAEILSTRPVATILQYPCNIARTSTCNVPVAMPKQNCAHIAVQYYGENIVETLQ